jgi:hypothetical protein
MKSVLLFIALLCQIAFAGDHSLTDIEGKEIKLKMYDHAIAGSIKDYVVFGHNDEEANTSELIIRKHGQIIKSTLSKTAAGLGGVITHNNDGITYITTIKFIGLNPQEQKYEFEINDEKVEVLVRAEDFQNNHFINPHYFVTFANGEKIDFKVLSGQACYRASLHLIMMVVGAYIH